MSSQRGQLAIISLLLGVTADWFFFGKSLGISVPLYVVLVLAGAVYVGYVRQARPPRNDLWLVGVLLFFALMVAVRASGMLQVFNVILIVYLSLLTSYLLTHPQRRLRDFTAADYFDRPIPMVRRYVTASLTSYWQSAGRLINQRQAKSYGPIVRGITLSLPLIILFLVLFSSADPLFRHYTTSLFSLRLDGELVARTVLVLLAASLLMGAYTLLFTSPQEPPLADGRLSKLRAKLGATEATIILSSVLALFTCFLLVQVTYLFGGSEQVTSSGLRYADYARKGFFELIAVATIAGALLWTIGKSFVGKNAALLKRFKVLSTLLIAEVLIIMLSAHIRLSLYEEAYGFTVLRLLSHLFIVWLGISLLLLGSFILRQEKESQFALRLFINVIAFFALLNLINPDALIARQNIERYQSSGKLDISYLTTLSEDALSAKLAMLEHSDERLRRAGAAILYYDSTNIRKESSSWQSFNISRHKTTQAYQVHQQKIESGQNDSRQFNNILK